MKRPLCYVCMVFVVTVFFYLKINSLTGTSVEESWGSEATFLGEVYQKEYKNERLVLYLEHVKKCDSDYLNTISYGVNSLEHSTSEEISDNNVKIICYLGEKNSEEKYDTVIPEMGSIIAIKGTPESFKKPRNPGQFDIKQYYTVLGIDFQLRNCKLLAKSKEFSLYHETLYRLRLQFEAVFDMIMPQKESSIMKAMVLGNKTGLDIYSKQLYQKSGISHILAISGLHISLIGMTLYRLLKRFNIPTVLSTAFAVIIMIMYGDMSGMSSSAFRAVFMFCMKLLADLLHRSYDMLTAMSLAAVLMLVEQPLYLYYSGFMLSFGAIMGIGCFSKSFKGSLSVFLIHFPIMLSVYYEFPIYSFLLNLVIIPAMSVVMALGVLCAVCGVIPLTEFGMGIAYIMGAGCRVLLWIFEFLSEISLSLPGAIWITGKPEQWKIICFYVGAIIIFVFQEYGIYISKKIKYTKKGICVKIPKLFSLLMILAMVNLLTGKTNDGLEITFVDVGQGDCIWIESPEGRHYLIDAGSTSENNLAQYTLIPFLKHMGTETLEAVFITHLDSDHTSAITELLEEGRDMYKQNGINIECIVLSKAVIKDEAYEKIVKLCNECEIPLVYAKAGDIIKADGNEKDNERLSFTILHPTDDYETESRNAYSLVIKLDYYYIGKHFGALFTGDVEADGEMLTAHYLKNTDWDCDLFKASHHGSKTSNTRELLEVIRPELTVISCGKDNSYGHPHEETLQRLKKVGSKVLTTAECGAITVNVGKGVSVHVFEAGSE